MSQQDMTSSPATIAAQDPADAVFTWFRTVLDTHPVYCDKNDLWQVFGYAEVARVLSDPVTFSSTGTVSNPPQPDVDLFAKGNIVRMDPPRHRELRALVSQAFTPRVVAGLTRRISQITMSLLDAADGAGRFDLVDALAYPLPATVIAELLGVPTDDLPRFRSWAATLFSRLSADATTLPGGQEQLKPIAPTIREMNEYLLARIRQHRRQPADDLLGRLTTAEIDGERLDDEEIAGFAGQLLQGGHIPSTALLGNAVLCFDRHPQAMAAVRADRELLPAAIEEVLRFRSPLPRLLRIATTDTEIGGVAVPEGRLVTPWIAAANRDTTRFPDPDRFDIHRNSTTQLAFGRGNHFCLGAWLARLEAKIVLGILLDRYRDIAVDPAASVEFYDPWVMIAVKRLPVVVAR
jgi:cytochrome P450